MAPGRVPAPAPPLPPSPSPRPAARVLDLPPSRQRAAGGAPAAARGNGARVTIMVVQPDLLGGIGGLGGESPSPLLQAQSSLVERRGGRSATPDLWTDGGQVIDDALECGPSDVYAFTLPEQLAQMCVIRFRVAGPRDTLNNPSARLNFLCVELQSTDLFRPSLVSCL